MKIHQIIGAASLLILSAWASADVYKWVDENGVTHYGNKKPPAAKVEQVRVSGGGVSRDESPDPLDKLEPDARELANAMKKELLKDHGNAELNCSKAVTNAIDQIDTYVTQAKRNFDGGYINQNQYDQVDSTFSRVKSRISTSRCQSASGIEKEFYLCMSNHMNSAVMCIDKAESIFK